MTTQNVETCLVLSVICGLMSVLSTAILAYPDAQKLRGDPWSPCMQRVALLLSLLFQLGIASTSITATWFGPVSLVIPTSDSAQLLFNMIFFGYLLGLESFSKEMRVGGYVVGLAAILLPVVGPGVQEDQDIVALLQKPGSLVWSGLLLVIFVVSSIGLAVSDRIRRREQDPVTNGSRLDFCMFTFNLMVDMSGSVIGTTVSKMFVLVQGASLGLCIALWLTTSLVLVYAIILQATTVTQGKFVPLSVSSKIVINGITGIIIWEDWRVITSWVGYACVFLYLILGNYLLCDVDLLGTKNATYGTAAAIEKVKQELLEEEVEEEQLSGDSHRVAESCSTADKSVSTASSSGGDEEKVVGFANLVPELAARHESTWHGRQPTTASGVWRKAYHVEKKDPPRGHRPSLNLGDEWDEDIIS